MVLDSKQFSGKGIKLGEARGGIQLDRTWLEDVSSELPKGESKQKLMRALDKSDSSFKIVTGVAFIDRGKGTFNIMRTEFK